VAHVDQTEVGGEAGDAEQAERQFGRDPRWDGADILDDGVVLPAEQAEHGVSDGHAVTLGFDHLADAGRSDDVADGDCRKVGVAAHPPPDGRVDRQVRHPDECLARPGRRNGLFFEPGGVVVDQGRRAFGEDDLAVAQGHCRILPPGDIERLFAYDGAEHDLGLDHLVSALAPRIRRARCPVPDRSAR
jgi:hypothetical protein